MPTTLPIRTADVHRERGVHKSIACLLLWAITMIALTLPVRPAYTADVNRIDMVLQ